MRALQKIRLCGLFILIASCSASSGGINQARARLSALGEIIVDEQQSGKPVVKIDLGAVPIVDSDKDAPSRVTDEELKALAHFPDVKWLSLYNANVTDSGIKHLYALPHVECLYLHGTQITDEGLEAVSRLTTIKWLDVSYTGVTSEGLMRYKARNPNCVVIAYHLDDSRSRGAE